MGLGRLIVRRRAGAEHARAITEYGFLNGEPVYGSELEYSGAYGQGMAIPGAWRAATLLSDLLGAVPWHAFRVRDGRLEPVATPPLLEQPNPPDTRMTTFASWALDLIWHGNAIGVVATRNAAGWPTSAVAVPASQVGVRRITQPGQSWLPVGAIEYRIGALTFGAGDVIHIKGPAEPGALRGMGVLETHVSTLVLAREQQRQAESISRHGVPTGLLKSANPDLTAAEARELKRGWLAAQRERTVAVLNSSTEFQPLSWNPEELQLVEARKYSLHELALIFGVPLSFLGVEQGSRTYTNQEQEGLNLLKFSLGGHLARFEQALSAHLPRGTIARANLDFLLRADTLTRYQAHEIALRAGFLTVDEVRDLEDRPPLPRPEPPPVPPVAGEQNDTEEQ